MWPETHRETKTQKVSEPLAKMDGSRREKNPGYGNKSRDKPSKSSKG